MGNIEDELRKRRFQASAADIQRRHRINQAAAARLQAGMGAEVHTAGNGVSPSFQSALGAAQKHVATFANRAPSRSDLDVVLERLRGEGKLPPEPRPDNVGYEPTAEEALGALAAAAEPHAPDGVELAPSADEALNSFPAESGDETASGETPAASSERSEPLARAGRIVQRNGKRNRSHRA